MKKVLTKNIPLKILSLFLAILLWVVIMNIDDPYITRTIVDVPVTELNTDVFTKLGQLYDVESGQTVDIKVRGKRSVIENMRKTDFEATADFKEISIVNAVPIRVKVKDQEKYREGDLDILNQNDVMTLTLEEADTQTFRVDVLTTGEVADGYYVTDMVANPNVIEISGSKKQIAKIKKVVVEVSVQQANKTFEVVTKPRALDENNLPVDDAKLNFQTKEIAVTVTVLPTKEIGIIVAKEGEPYYGYTLVKMVHEPKVITIAGTESDLRDIGYITIPFSVSMSKETLVDTKSIEDYLDMNKYTIVGDSTSIAITATIEKISSKDIIIQNRDIMVEGLEPGYVAKINTPGPINLHVMGPEEELSNVTKESLSPTIRLGEYKPGTYSITIDCILSESLTIRPVTISVEIMEDDTEK